MASVNSDTVLSHDQLNDMDRWILDFLDEHEWATPNLLKQMYNDEQDDSGVSRQWVSDRLLRLEEHQHVTKVHPNAAERFLVDDPRTDD
jgi:hypothetical protein